MPDVAPQAQEKQPFFGSSWGLKRLTAEGFLLRGPGWPLRISAVFQEDRLCPSFSPMENVQMALKEKWKEEKLAQAMICLLPKECLYPPRVHLERRDEAAHRHSAGRSCAFPYACNG